MGARLTSWPARFGLLRTLVAEVRLAVRLLREPRVPLLLKAVPVLALLYVVVPFDAVPDVLPLVGQIDDLGLLVVALQVFRRLCPSDAVAFHRAAVVGRRRYAPAPATGDVIDAEWRRE